MLTLNVNAVTDRSACGYGTSTGTNAVVQGVI